MKRLRFSVAVTLQTVPFKRTEVFRIYNGTEGNMVR